MKPNDSLTWGSNGVGESVGTMGSSRLFKSLPGVNNLIIKRQLQYNDSNKFKSLPQTFHMKSINEKITTKNEKTTLNSNVYLSDKNSGVQGKSNKATDKNNSNLPLEKRGKEELMRLFSKNQKFESNSQVCKQLKHTKSQTSPKSLYGGEENEEEAKINKDMGEKENPEKLETGNTAGTENQPMKKSNCAALWLSQLKEMLKSGETTKAELLRVFPNVDPVTLAELKNVLNTVNNSKINKTDFQALINEGTDVIMKMLPRPIKNDVSESVIFVETMKDETMQVEENIAENKIMSSLPVEEGKTFPECDEDLANMANRKDQKMQSELAPDGGRQSQSKQPQMSSKNKVVVYLEESSNRKELRNQTKEPQLASGNQYVDCKKEVIKQKNTRVAKKRRQANRKVDSTKLQQICVSSAKIKKPKYQRKRPLKNQRINNGEWMKRNAATLDVFKKPKRLDMKKGGKFRCCSQSDASGSRNGSGCQGNSSGGSQNFSNNSDKEQPNQHGSEYGRGNGDKPNGRRNNSPNQNMTPGDLIRAQNYKSVRKKADMRIGSSEEESLGPDKPGHGSISDQSYLIVAIGRLSSTEPNIIFDPDLNDTFREIEQCLVHYLRSLSTGRGQDNNRDCDICDIVISLLRHFGCHPDALMSNCTMCLQLYHLFKFHFAGCCVTDKSNEECTHTLYFCQQIHCQATSYVDDPHAFEKFLWQKLKESFCRLHLGNVNLSPAVQPQKKIPAKRQSVKRKVSSQATLRKIPEDEDAVDSTTQQSGPSQPSSCASHGSAESQNSINENTSHSSLLLRNMPETPLSFPPRHGRVETPDRNIHVYGEQGCQSVPVGYLPQNPTVLNSLEDRPTGVPGIGEVVYGSHSNLRRIAEHWSSLRQKQVSGGLPSRIHQREEGVILTQHIKKLGIGKTRYQEGVQWEKLTPLGQGVSGRCYLARDYNSEIQFCVKQIPLMKFFQDELTIWSKLNHPNIVQLYGAIRCGDTVFILAEFVDGGCLTEHINNQRELKRRLSKPVALRYFQQLLQVLVYLQEQNVIHEDLKADNILLRAASYKSEIVVADFGLARQVQPGERVRPTVPLGTPTQWSPEKAASAGYDFRSDVWAATCVLAHIFNGDPPWVRHFEGAVFQYVISTHSPPLDDMPLNVTDDIEELFRLGWTTDMEKRPDARSLLEKINIGLHLSGDRLFSNIGPVFSPNYQEQNQIEPSSVEILTLNNPETVTSAISTAVGNLSLTNMSQSLSRSNQQHEAVFDNSLLPMNEGRSDSYSSSDPQQHIVEFIRDDHCKLPNGPIPYLPIFQEPSAETHANGTVNMFKDVKQHQKLRRVSIETPIRRARSPSAPNIPNIHRSQAAAFDKINSVDLYGYGPDESQPTKNDTHGGSGHDVKSGHKHAKLHLIVPRPGDTSRLQYQTSYGGARPKTIPYTASPSLPTVVSKKSLSPSSISPVSSSDSRANSGSKPGTPRSGQSAREHQDRELHSFSQSQFHEHILQVQARSPDHYLELLAETNNQDDDDDDDDSDNEDENKDNDDNDDQQELLKSLALFNIQTHDHMSKQQTHPVSPGCLISFATRDKLLTTVRIKDPSKNWLEVIVDIAAPKIHTQSGYQAFSVLLPDDRVVDMGASVGTLDLQVTVVPINPQNDVHSWYVEDQKFLWNSSTE